MARGDRRVGKALLEAHRLGCRLDGWDAPDAFTVLGSVTLAECEAFLCENLTRERLALSVIRPNT